MAILLLFSAPAAGQTLEWVNQPLAPPVFGGIDAGRAVACDATGNTYVTGAFQGTADFDFGPGTADRTSAGSADIFITKYDAFGNYLWAIRVGGTNNETGLGIAVDGSGDVYVTGHFQSANVDFDPGAGTANLSSAGGEDIFIAKYDASGNYLWAIRVGSTFSDIGYGLAVDGSGNAYVTGQFEGTADFDPGAGTANLSSAGSADIFIAKYDASGNYVWASRMGGTGSEAGTGLALDFSGNAHVTGYFEGTADFDPGAGTANLTSAGGGDIFIAKYDASGNYLWANQVGGTGLDTGYGLALNISGDVYMTGFFDGTNIDFDPGAGTANLSSAGGADLFIAKYDASGIYLWANSMGGTGGDTGLGIAVDSSNVHVTGYFQNTNVDFDPGAGTANLTSAGGSDLFIAKYDGSGNYVWANSAGGTNSDIGYGIATDGSGNVHVTGLFHGTVDFDPGAGTVELSAGFAFSGSNVDAFALRLSLSGNYDWAVNWGGYGSQPLGMECRAIARDASGNVYATGNFQGSKVDFDPGAGTANLSSAGNNDIFIAKYDASGNYVWAKRVGGTTDEVGYGIAVDGSGNVFVTGYFRGTNVDFDPGAGTANLTSAAGFSDLFIAKYNASGNYLWAKRVGGANNDEGYGIAVDGSGNVYVTGYFESTNVDFDPGAGTANLSSAGSFDIFIAKYDVLGNYLWAKQIGGTSVDVGYGIALDGGGNVCMAGGFANTNVDFDPGAGTANLSSVGSFDIFIAKYDVSGNYLWAKQIGGTSLDVGYGIALDGSGNVHVTGVFYGTNVDFDPGAGTANLSSAGSTDIFIAKYNASGNYLWAKRVGGANNDEGRGIAVDGSGNVYMTGSFEGTADFDPGAGTANLTSAGNWDIFLAKYNASGNYLLAMRAGSAGTDIGYCIAAGGAGKINAGGIFGQTVDFDPGGGTVNRTAVASGGDLFIAQYSSALPSLSFSGVIKWEHDGTSGVRNATVNITGAGSGSGLTDINGNFTANVPYTTGNFTVKPVKNINRYNGLNVADVVAIQQHVSNTNPITNPYKMIAADMNLSNSITTFDASFLNQCLIGNPLANSLFRVSWRFMPQTWTPMSPPWGFPEQINLTGVSTNQSGLNFYGVKVGDVTAAFANPANFGAGEPLVWRVQDRVLQAGETMEVEFRADQLDDVAAFQFALYFDPATLQFDGLEPLGGLPLTLDHFGLFNVSEGEVRVVWTGEKGLPVPEAAAVFRLRFMVLEEGERLSEVFGLNDETLAGRVYNGALSESKVDLTFDQATGANEPVIEGLQLGQNRPNPFAAETAIDFRLPGACMARLRIFDATGREWWRTEKSYPEGLNTEKVRIDRLAASGVLYYELTTPFGVLTRRMVRIE